MIFDVGSVEKILGYSFKDKELLRTCFTHPSYTNEHKGYKNYERLEFLGDSILGYIVSEYLFFKKSGSDEGVLTGDKQKYVSSAPLAETIKSLGLNEYILFGHGNLNDKEKNSVCENLFEAIVATLYLDGGIELAKSFITKYLLSNENKEKNIDYKSELQIVSQKNKLGLPVYRVISKTGKDHNPTFKVEVFIADKSFGVATGNKKSKAENECAKIALKKLGKDI